MKISKAVQIEIAKLELKPGDKLLVRVPKTLPANQVVRIAEAIKQRVGVDVLCYTDELEISVLRSDKQEAT